MIFLARVCFRNLADNRAVVNHFNALPTASDSTAYARLAFQAQILPGAGSVSV